jgi:hypothetical protein
MSTPIVFKGLNHYPKGNVALRSEKDNVFVSGMKNSFDGLTIETNGA